MFGRTKVSMSESICVNRRLLEELDNEFKKYKLDPDYERTIDFLLSQIIPDREPKLTESKYD